MSFFLFQAQAILADKEKLEKDLKRLNDKLAFTLSDCNAKDEQVKKQTKIVQEAVAGNFHAFLCLLIYPSPPFCNSGHLIIINYALFLRVLLPVSYKNFL